MMKLRKLTIYEDDRVNVPESSQETKNIVVFGESGVGKSSLINLLAGTKVSETSSGALGCTLEYKRHLLILEDRQFAIWDTAGLDEGTEGSVPADKAEAYLKQLLHELVKNNGVDLLVYCVRGTRVRSALLMNYHIFYSAICRKKVPIAIVITGLENQEGSMETWWYKNEPQFSLLRMYFDSHACVTTLETSVENPLLRERREISRVAVVKTITTTCRTQRWKPTEHSWVESAYSDIRAMLSPRDSYAARLPIIIMCETFGDPPGGPLTRKRSISFQNPVTLTLSLSPLSFRSPVSISSDNLRSKLPFGEGIKCTPERLYRVYQVSPKPAPLSEGTGEETKKVAVVKRGADLLVFCVRMEETEPRVVKFQWEHFNVAYGGDLAPQIVVVVGASDQPVAEKWWRDAVGTFVKNDVDVAYWPSDAVEKVTGIEVEAARRRLQYLIQDRCIDCSKVTFAKNEKLFRRSLLLDLSNLWNKPEGSSKGDGPTPHQDMLTRAGVWYDVQAQERSPTITSPLSPTSLLG